ncbi:terminase gpA endonuclease subunit [uncultured Cohaesibacter sp.]|uniref:terminase gpA endonuclease subunit n=1 Tax=uncultured Cohaesibacter sp. TaxID=1002546 RepID=UPI0029C6CC3B|nr:terminase gpA endonuclease subunit [uncultured Cohaesibacter sp.]
MTSAESARSTAYKGRFYHFSANAFKWALYRSLTKIDDPARRSYVAFPRGLDDDYFDQIAAEKRVRKVTKTGFVKYVWEKDPNQANEALDMLNQAEAAARRSGVFDASDEYWDKLEAMLGQSDPDAQMDIEDMMARQDSKTAVIAETAVKLHAALTDLQKQAEATGGNKPSTPDRAESATLRRIREKREKRENNKGP